MPRTLYSPRLSDDVVRALYREGLRQGQPMTRLADALLRDSLGLTAGDPPALRVCEDQLEPRHKPQPTRAPDRKPGAA
jgi:hypothetical protein